ncbi:MAG TPA: PP0621 family protein [Rubrivivax sp.]|nr:PP0621 family protein [Rubrivivax sp.]
MKYLVVLLVVVGVAWLLLRTRSRDRVRRAPPGPQAKAREVVACRHCGVHLPRDESVADATGSYCSHEHRIAGPRPP